MTEARADCSETIRTGTADYYSAGLDAVLSIMAYCTRILGTSYRYRTVYATVYRYLGVPTGNWYSGSSKIENRELLFESIKFVEKFEVEVPFL